MDLEQLDRCTLGNHSPASPAPRKGAGFEVPRSSAHNLQIKMIISIYILLSSCIATAAFAIGVAQRRERRRLVTMAADATIPHRFEQPLSEIAALRMELELRTLQLEAERIETDRLRAIVRETLR